MKNASLLKQIFNKTYIQNLLLFYFFFILIAYSKNIIAKENIISEYSSTNHCKLKEEVAEGASFKMQCPSKAGYKIYLEGFDGRSWLSFKKGAFEIATQDWDNPYFIFVNIAQGKIEWRYHISKGKKQLKAIIYRVDIFNSNDQNTNQHLNVVRVQDKHWCYLGSTEDNESARKLADSNADCSSSKQ